MEKQTKIKFLYIGALILALAAFGTNIALLQLAACVLLPPLAFRFFAESSARKCLLFSALGSIVTIVAGYVFYRSIGIGVLFATLLFILPALQHLFLFKTANLYENVFYGGMIFIGLLAASVIILAREYFGVWDIHGIFKALENTYLQSIAVVEKTYASVLGAEQLAAMQPILASLREGVSELSLRFVSLMLSSMLVWYFLSLVWGKKRSGISHEQTYFIIPRGVGIVYIVIFIITALTKDTAFQALNTANTLFGYLFVIAACDRIQNNPFRPKKHSATGILLLLAAFISESFLMGIVYTVLLVMGIFTGSRPVIQIIRKGSDE